MNGVMELADLSLNTELPVSSKVIFLLGLFSSKVPWFRASSFKSMFPESGKVEPCETAGESL